MMNNYFVLSYAGHNLTLPSVSYLVLFIILSVIVNAIAIYFAADLVTKSSTAGKALFVAIIAPIYFIVIFLILSIIFGLFLAVFGFFLALLIAFLALIHFIGSTYNTGMAGGFVIAVISVLILIVMSFVVGLLLGVSPIFVSL